MPTIVYDFQGAGAGAVRSQIRDVDQSASRAAANEGKRAKKLRRNRARNRLKRIREAKKAAQQEARIAEQGAKTIERAEIKAERNKERRQKKLRRNRARNRLKSIREAERAAKKEAAAVAKAQKTGQAKRAGRLRAVGGLALGVAGAAAGAVIGGGLALASAATRQQIGLEEKARTLSVQARGAGERAVDPRSIVADAQKTALQVGGTTAESVIDAMSTFVTRTGRFDLAKAFGETFATVAKATGADASDIAGAAADLFEKFDITSINDMQKAMATLTFQGKKGAFELADAAAQFPKLAAAASRLGLGKGVRAVEQLGGLTQIARTSTGSAEAAATSLEAVFTGLTTQQKALGKAGVQVFDKKTGKARDIEALLVDVITKVGGTDIAKKKGDLAKIFGRQGIRALTPLIAAYANATGDAAAKQEAVANALNDAIDAPGTWNDVVEDAAIMNESMSSRLTTAWESIVAASGETLSPAIMDLAEALTSTLVEGGGLEAIATGFDILAENAKFLGDVLGEVAGFLKDLGLIEGPTTAKVIEREQANQSKLDRRIAAKVSAKAPILERSKTGKNTAKDFERLAEIDADIEALNVKKDVSIGVEKGAREKQAAPFRAATVKGDVTEDVFFTQKEFAKQFAAAAGARSKLEATTVFGPVEALIGGDRNIMHGAAIAKSIARGEGVATLGFTETQKDLINELGGQVQALGAGVGVAAAPAGALGLTAEQEAAKVAKLGAAADKAAKQLGGIKAPGAGDIT